MLLEEILRYYEGSELNTHKYFSSDELCRLKNALSEVYDLVEVTYKNDLWHVDKNIKSNWNRDQNLSM